MTLLDFMAFLPADVTGACDARDEPWAACWRSRKWPRYRVNGTKASDPAPRVYSEGPIQPVEEGFHGLASRTSRRCSASGVAATRRPSISCCHSSMRSCDAWPRANSGTSGPTTPCSRPLSFTRCISGSSTNARSTGRIEPTSLASRRRSCAGSWSITPVVTARANGATVCAACRSMKRKTSRRQTRCPSSRWIRRSLAWKASIRDLARIVELRAFGGLTIEEAAHVLSVSPSTAKRDWRTAKSWLNRELGSEVRP